MRNAAEQQFIDLVDPIAADIVVFNNIAVDQDRLVEAVVYSRAQTYRAVTGDTYNEEQAGALYSLVESLVRARNVMPAPNDADSKKPEPEPEAPPQDLKATTTPATPSSSGIVGGGKQWVPPQERG